MSAELLTEDHLGFLSLIGGYTVSSESTLVKIPNCWKSHVMAQIYYESSEWMLQSSECYHPSELHPGKGGGVDWPPSN